jgi:hypothetical protein
MRNVLLSLLLSLAMISVGHADDLMDTEIDYILDTVAASDCKFIRNGKEYGPEAAKDHLNLKRRRGKKYFSNADEFIENLASSSSWSGDPYYIRCGGQEPQLAKEWFSAVLAQYRAYRGAPTKPVENL